jgi:GAF domain-containing protein/HAMP domain-containing protein
MLFRKKPKVEDKTTKISKSRQFNPRIFMTSLVIFAIAIAVSFIVLSIIITQYTYFILAGSFSISAIVGVLTISKNWEANESTKYLLFAFLIEISITLTAAIFTSFSGFPYSIIAISIAFLITTTLPKGSNSDWIIWTGLLAAIGSVLLSILAPFPQIQNQFVQWGIVGFAVLMGLLLVTLFILGTINANLRVKLILGALGLALVPLTALALINNQFLQTSIQQQSNNSLQVAANQTISMIDGFFQQNLESISDEASLPSVINYLSLDPNVRAKSPQESELKAAFRSLQTKEKVYLPSYALLDLSGLNIIDTEEKSIGKSERSTSYFQQSETTGTSYASTVQFIPASREAYVYFISPVVNPNRQVIGFLRTKYDARIFQSMIAENVGLIGSRSYPILLDENGMRLADGSSPNLLFRTVSQLSTEKFTNLLNNNRIPPYMPQALLANEQPELAQVALNPRTSNFFTTSTSIGQKSIPQSGIIVTMQYQPWNVIILQDQTGLIDALATQNRLSAVISTLIAGIVAILITIIANSFSRPILQLTDAAEKVSTGDLSVQASVTSRDEIGMLSNSFNSMTRQLKNFIDTLENRVRERTQQLAEQNETLQFRSRQLQTVADVAREMVSSRDLESLLTTVTTLISERFGFYHVGIFLNDQQGDYSILRAANSAGGRKMLSRQHKLQVGQVGIVGYVTGAGEPRIATDVGQDAVFFNNPDLPDTKSEMALPLKVGNKVIGALDVQSIESNAFSNEDIELFSTLADQTAIAINNNQLFTDTTKALEESERVHKQYLNQEWTKQSTEFSSKNYKFTSNGLVSFSGDLPEIKVVLESARPIFRSQKNLDGDGSYTSTLAVPILLRGESIGVIHLQETGPQPYTWSQSDLQTVQTVADQVSQTLENARLFEQTIRRADRERKVLDITSKIRSTNDPQEMLQITLEELKKNLGATKAQIIVNMTDNELNLQHSDSGKASSSLNTQSETSLLNEE